MLDKIWSAFVFSLSAHILGCIIGAGPLLFVMGPFSFVASFMAIYSGALPAVLFWTFFVLYIRPKPVKKLFVYPVASALAALILMPLYGMIPHAPVLDGLMKNPVMFAGFNLFFGAMVGLAAWILENGLKRFAVQKSGLPGA